MVVEDSVGWKSRGEVVVGGARKGKGREEDTIAILVYQFHRC